MGNTTREAQRDWKPIVGVATAAATAVAGALPATAAAPPEDAPQTRAAEGDSSRADGAYESCSAYFGFGKWDYGVADVVSFDVVDDNGDDGVAHAVGTDTEVVFHITTELGELTCAPEEVTQAEWDAAMDEVRNNTDVEDTPAWPGPGHYAYPSVAWQAWLGDDLGEVTATSFEVVGLPGGAHALVSPGGRTPLVQNHVIGWDRFSGLADTRVLDLVETEAGPAAAQALEDALTCDTDPPPFTEDTATALNVLRAQLGMEPLELGDFWCNDASILHSDVSLRIALYAAADYTETIHLRLPVEPTTSTTAAASDSPSPTTPATPATPVTASPRYTG